MTPTAQEYRRKMTTKMDFITARYDAFYENDMNHKPKVKPINMKYHVIKKNEGTWIKWSVIDEKDIVRFVGRAKEAKQFIKKNNDMNHKPKVKPI